MILFLPLAPLNTQFIFSKHVESVILLWKYFVPMQNHFCEISFHSENAPNKLSICLFLTSCYRMHVCVHIFFFAKPAYLMWQDEVFDNYMTLMYSMSWPPQPQVWSLARSSGTWSLITHRQQNSGSRRRFGGESSLRPSDLTYLGWRKKLGIIYDQHLVPLSSHLTF